MICDLRSTSEVGYGDAMRPVEEELPDLDAFDGTPAEQHGNATMVQPASPSVLDAIRREHARESQLLPHATAASAAPSDRDVGAIDVDMSAAEELSGSLAPVLIAAPAPIRSTTPSAPTPALSEPTPALSEPVIVASPRRSGVSAGGGYSRAGAVRARRGLLVKVVVGGLFVALVLFSMWLAFGSAAHS